MKTIIKNINPVYSLETVKQEALKLNRVFQLDKTQAPPRELLNRIYSLQTHVMEFKLNSEINITLGTLHFLRNETGFLRSLCYNLIKQHKITLKMYETLDAVLRQLMNSITRLINQMKWTINVQAN